MYVLAKYRRWLPFNLVPLRPSGVGGRILLVAMAY